MRQLTLDAIMLAKLRTLCEATEMRDEAGHVLGLYYPLSVGQQAVQAEPPFTREEIERRRKNRTGRPLADILKDLGAQ